MSERRPKRRCVSSKKAQGPSAIHYVGYVEDNETPEMIMKKFEELERIQKAAEAKRQQQQQQRPTDAAPSPADALQPAPDGAGPSSALHFAPTNVDHPNASPQGQSQAQPGAAQSTRQASGQQEQQQQQQQTEEERVLDEEVLLEVFKHTSIFNVGGGGEALLGGGGGGYGRYDPYNVAYGMEDTLLVGGELGGGGASDLDDDDLLDEKEFWSDEDYELGGRSREGAGGRSSSRRKGGGAGGKGAGSGAQRSDGGEGGSRAAGRISGPSRHAQHQVVTQYNRDTNALIRRRVTNAGGAGGGGGLVQLRVPPPPLPLSWGRTVRPYQPPPEAAAAAPATAADETAAAASAAAAAAGTEAVAEVAVTEASSSSRGFEASDVACFPFDSALGGKTYVAVMVNAGWQPQGAAEAFEEGGEAEVMRRFRALPIPRLCPRGFILVWAHKGLLQAVCRALAAWGYVYVENLTWVHLTPANAIAAQAGRHFRRSHSTLLMFRREGEGRDIELRHQRNPDVVFDCIRCLPDGGGWDVPSEVLTTIETMLPGGKGAFLELWAPRGMRRPGWDHVSEVRSEA